MVISFVRPDRFAPSRYRQLPSQRARSGTRFYFFDNLLANDSALNAI
ncbi:hypothetical protein RSPO_m01559 (plasmid) [Ralstonia solanacearum Po82]|uniref:Uncharacterized protein n=1 Tax=Ralstonia solanacearum (strain Po82) TaxID=1031711 RepID=F6GBQ4_RALS8|nr:hypothetical protein RSPO_m01559 [Ralstonia solanacearum Po82]